MSKNFVRLGLLSIAAMTAFTSCEDQEFTNQNVDAKRVDIQTLSPELAKVRDYVPLYAVIAHRGSTFWAPEETESAWRWAREMGVDYLESDLQCTKDGVVLANHDENLKRTTNIENVFSELVPTTRVQFYESLGFAHDDAVKQYERDIAAFRPFYTMSYYYAELLMLDAGEWFNETSLEQARPTFKGTQYVSALQDQIAYAEGKMLKRDANGNRVLTYNVKPEYQGMTLQEIYEAIKAKGEYNAKYMDFIEYHWENAYVDDPQDTGHRPGIYIEFKESWLNPGNMEKRVYDVLDECGWNIITKPASETAFYKNGKVNVGNTNGKVILQSFSFDATNRAFQVFKGRVPFCYLLWTSYPGDYATDIKYDTPTGVAAFIKTMQDHGCHIIGPAISGAPNNYPEMNCPWQAYMVRRAGMINHPYSFDSQAQITKHMGYWNYGWETEFDDLMKVTIKKTPYSVFPGDSQTWPIYMDGCFTNHTEMNLQYMIDNGMRCNSQLPNPFHPGQNFDNSQAPSTVPNAVELLNNLGY